MVAGNLNILLIDDNKNILNTVPVDLTNSLREQGVAVKVDGVLTIEDGLEKLRSTDYHLAIIDLRFPGDSGNTVIGRILDTRVLPIIIFSGYPKDLDKKFTSHGLIRTTRKKKAGELISMILEWNQKNVFAFFTEDGILSRTLRKVLQETMWNNVSRYWQYISTNNTASLEMIAGRMAATLFYDVLSCSPDYAGDGGEVHIHHGEIYLFNTPRKYLAPGDLLSINGKQLVVLSPACDLILRSGGGSKSSQVMLAICHDLKGFADNQNHNIRDQITTLKDDQKSPEKKEHAKDRLAKLMRQDWENDSGQYFYLPPFANFKGGVVDFLELIVEPYENQVESLVNQRILTLNKEITAELATRFARYMIRLGQPAYDVDALIKSFLEVM